MPVAAPSRTERPGVATSPLGRDPAGHGQSRPRVPPFARVAFAGRSGGCAARRPRRRDVGTGRRLWRSPAGCDPAGAPRPPHAAPRSPVSRSRAEVASLSPVAPASRRGHGAMRQLPLGRDPAGDGRRHTPNGPAPASRRGHGVMVGSVSRLAAIRQVMAKPPRPGRNAPASRRGHGDDGGDNRDRACVAVWPRSGRCWPSRLVLDGPPRRRDAGTGAAIRQVMAHSDTRPQRGLVAEDGGRQQQGCQDGEVIYDRLAWFWLNSVSFSRTSDARGFRWAGCFFAVPQLPAETAPPSRENRCHSCSTAEPSSGPG
jgi:hypothetical protein